MKTQAEVAQELRDIKAALLPLGPKIQALLDAATKQPNATDELSAAADDLQQEGQTLATLFTPVSTDPGTGTTDPGAGTTDPGAGTSSGADQSAS